MSNATTLETCNASSRITSDGGNPFAGNPAVYVTPLNVKFAHSSTSWLRLGRTNDVSVMINGTDEQQTEYFEGILIATIVIFCFFTVWLMTVFILKCCGHQHVGFFSGQRIRRPMPPTPPHDEMGKFANEVDWAGESEENKANRILAAYQESNGDLFLQTNHNDTTPFEANTYNHHVSTDNTGPSPAVVEYCEKVQEWQRQVKITDRRQRRVRIVVIFCCIGVIVSSILMVVKGVDSITKSVQDVRTGLDQTSSLATKAINLIDEFTIGQDTAINSTKVMLLEVNGICPPLREQLCDDILTAQNCNFAGLPFEEEFETVVNYFAGVQDLVYTELEGFHDDLEEVIEIAADVDAQITSFEWAFYVAAAFATALAVLSLSIMIGVIMAWNEKLDGSCFRWVRNLVVVPIFVLLVFLSLLFSCIFVIGSLTTADVCYGSPDDVVLEVLATKEDDFGSVMYNFIEFYVGGCPENVVPLPIDDEVNRFLAYLDTVAAFLKDLDSDQAFEQTCGINKGILISGISIVVEVICLVTITILDIRDYLNCDNWNSLYSTVAYDAVCSNATVGFTWISSTQLAIVFFSMLIVTLRVACYEIEDEEDFQIQRRCCARLCGCFSSSKKKDGNDNVYRGHFDEAPVSSSQNRQGDTRTENGNYVLETTVQAQY